MTENDLKNKIQEWLGLKKAADSLEKAFQEEGVHNPSPLQGRPDKYPGKSHASFQKPGIEKLIHKLKLKELRDMPKPNLPKSENENQPKGHVENKDQVFRPHEARPTLADVSAKKRIEAAKKKVQKSIQPIPASVSEPIKENRVDSEHPKTINGPVIVNAYKSEGTQASGNFMLVNDIIQALKRKSHGS